MNNPNIPSMTTSTWAVHISLFSKLFLKENRHMRAIYFFWPFWISFWGYPSSV